MSVIANWQATPRRFEILFNLVATGRSGKNEDELRRVVTSAAQKDSDSDSTLFPNACGEALKVGLLLRQDSRIVVPDRGDVDWSPAELRSEYRRRIHSALLPDPSDHDAVQRAEDFPHSVAWLLLQSPWAPLRSDEEPARLLECQVGDEGVRSRFRISTKDSWRNFLYWARALGFCSYMSLGSGFYVTPDPTLALRSVRDAILPSSGEQTASDLVGRVGKALPVLDGGIYRTQLLDIWRTEQPDRTHLSGALSIALLRMESAGELEFIDRSDGDPWFCADPIAARRFTHVRRR